MKIPSSALLAPVLTVALALAGPARGEQPPIASRAPAALPAPQAQHGRLSGHDRVFILHALKAGRTEVEAGKLAQRKGRSEEIRQFGRRMAEDHAKAGRKLEDIARQLGYRPPERRDKVEEDQLTLLKSLSGDEFDAAYAKVQLEAHKKAVALFGQEAKQGQAEPLRQFASRTLDTLEEHMRMARNLPYANKIAQRQAARGRSD